MKSIKLIGKDFHFGIGFLNELIDNTELDLYQIDEKLAKGDISIIPNMIYYSHLYACKRKDIDVTFNKYDVNDWIDDNGGLQSGFVIDFINAFKDSLIKDVPIDENKKKVTTKKK